MIIFTYIAYILIIFIAITLISFLLSKVKFLGFLSSVASYAFAFSLFLAFILAVFYYGYFLISLIILTYSISRNILSIFFIVELATYLALFIDLVFIAYFIEFVGYLILKPFELLNSTRSYKMSQGFKSFVRMLRPKMFLYLFATVFTIIASIENIVDGSLIVHSEWNNIKPFLYEATVSFIALDGFISLIIDKKGEVLRNFKKNGLDLVIDYFKSVIDSSDKGEDSSRLPE